MAVYAPTQACMLCGRVIEVTPDGRGFPPDIAKRRLVKACKAAGCRCEPQYTPGFIVPDSQRNNDYESE